MTLSSLGVPVSPRSYQLITSTTRPKRNSAQKVDCQPKSWSSMPPSAGATMGTIDMPIVT